MLFRSGELTVEPGAANVIPGRVTLSIDLRGPDDAARLQAWETIADRINRLAQEGGVDARALELEHTPAVACDPRLRALLAAAASAFNGSDNANCTWVVPRRLCNLERQSAVPNDPASARQRRRADLLPALRSTRPAK